MKPSAANRRVFFEPWSLGDVMIAAAALRELKGPVALACHSSWHPLLRQALADLAGVDLITVDLPYTTRNRGNPFDAGASKDSARYPDVAEVLSIRGDLRDFSAARKIFPRARIRMNGWARFFGRKSALVNFPYAIGLLPVENRYRSWANLIGIPYEHIEATYRQRQMHAPSNNRVAIHIGAQWRSKQYPEVISLRHGLLAQGSIVTIIAGPNDPLPPEVTENDVVRAIDRALVDQLRSAGQVITNDSGPMHLAAFLGCRTTAIVRTSPIEEWAPPAVQILRSSETPRGYRPDRRYMSDEVFSGWPSASTVAESLLV